LTHARPGSRQNLSGLWRGVLPAMNKGFNYCFIRMVSEINSNVLTKMIQLVSHSKIIHQLDFDGGNFMVT
jgi:hypothetical protein